jgi:3-dehydroquinate synthase
VRALQSRVVASAAPVLQPPAVSKVSTVVDVDLGERSYIYIGPGLLDEPELLQRYSKSAGFR